MPQIFQFKISPSDQGSRLDIFLAEKIPEFSRAMIQKMIKGKNILINPSISSGQVLAKSSYKIKTGDIIKINPPIDKIDLAPDPSIKFEIIHNEKDFAVIGKPAGLVVYPGTKHNEKTLVNGLLAIWPEIKSVGDDPLRPGIVHRLDKDTSGIMIIAKNNAAFEYFKNLFKNKKIEKTYIALVFGHITGKEGKIEFPIRRSKSNPVKQVAIIKKEKEDSHEAVTYFKTLKLLLDNEGNQYTLIEAMPKTGRMHQIRVHLSTIGHPVVGDMIYQTKNTKQPPKISRQLLHASAIKFQSQKGTDLEFNSPLPNDFSGFLQTLKEN